MRNSEAQRYARWSLAAAGLLALVVAGVYLRNAFLARQAEKKAPPAVPPTIEQRSNEFSFSKVEGQRTIYTVRASRATEFKEGSRNLLEDVAIVVYGKNGERNDTLQTRACDFISNTGKISCAGEVQINLRAAGAPPAGGNSVQIATSVVTFDRDSGEARTDKPVTFHWPAGEGSAVGVTYVSSSGILRLRHSVELRLYRSAQQLPEKTELNAEQIVHVAGDSMSFQRDARLVTVDGNVHAQQVTHELTAAKMSLELDAAFQARRFVASGHPQLHDLTLTGPVDLGADEIASSLRADGSIASIVATGSVHGTRNTEVGGDGIDAGRVELDLVTADNMPRLLTASSGVMLTSTTAAFNGGARHVETDGLEVHFSKNSRPGEILLESMDTLAPARVAWDNEAIVNGKPVPQSTQMTGKQMNLRFDAQNQLQELVSTGGVEVKRKLGGEPEQVTASRQLSAKFDKAGDWTTIDQTGDVRFHDSQRAGQGDHARVDHASNTVKVDGSAIFADAATRTTAQSASFVQGSNTLRADGHVTTTDLRPSAAGISNLAQAPAHVSAEHLLADGARGHALYSGKARMWQGQSVIEGDTIELDSPTHALLAQGHVRGVFPQAPWNPKPGQARDSGLGPASRPVSGKTPGQAAHSGIQLGHVSGERLTYWEAESRGRIEQNARVDSEQGSIQAHQIDLYFSDSGAASGTKQLSRSVANGEVTVRQEDRRGTSDRAEYTAAEGKFVLSEGKPTLYSSTGDTTTGRQLTFYFADDRIVVDSADGSKTVTLHQVEK
jgi:lipopolysaccharide export system protein LptA/lipopolysaccharide export system protein LptC